MHIQVSYANHKAMTKILGQLHIFSGTFTAQNKSWCATEKEAYTVLKSVQRFDYFQRGAKCTLRCDYKWLEPFLSRGMKITKFNRWAMIFQEYDITFIHIWGKDNILTDAISKVCTINVYEDPVENKQLHSPTTQNTMCPNKVTDTIQWLDFITALQLLNITTTVLCNLQNKISFVKSKYVNCMQVSNVSCI